MQNSNSTFFLICAYDYRQQDVPIFHISRSDKNITYTPDNPLLCHVHSLVTDKPCNTIALRTLHILAKIKARLMVVQLKIPRHFE